jgi:hypothetical protein
MKAKLVKKPGPGTLPRKQREKKTIFTLAEQQRRLAEFRKEHPEAYLTPDFFNPQGRKSEFNAELHGLLLYQHLAQGHTITTFGAVIGYSRETVYQWLRDFPIFQECRELGEQARAKLVEKIGLQQAITGKGSYQAWAMFAYKYLDWVPPAQAHTVAGGDKPLEFRDIGNMSPEETREEIERLIAKREARAKAKAIALAPIEVEQSSVV